VAGRLSDTKSWVPSWLDATGIVGVRLEEKSHQWGSHTIEFLSLGTAVVKTSDEVTLPRPTTIISLDN
jgi:hypothetical protein